MECASRQEVRRVGANYYVSIRKALAIILLRVIIMVVLKENWGEQSKEPTPNPEPDQRL